MYASTNASTKGARREPVVSRTQSRARTVTAPRIREYPRLP